MKQLGSILILVFGIWIIIVPYGCKHEPIIGDMDMPIDTTDTDTMNNDTTGMDTTAVPCDSSVIYFERDILPILRSGCAKSGCHDAASAQEDIILVDYQSTINSDVVEAFSLDDSDLFEVITEDDPDKIMPEPPNPPLSSDQINLIANWILQGAENKTCDDNQAGCDTVDVSYSGTIEPMLETYCVGCHNSSLANGGVDLSSYQGVRTVAMDGRLRGVSLWLSGYPMMPQGGDQLPDCELDQIISWIDAGAPNN